MSERENEWKPISGFSIQHYCDAVSMLLPSLLYEAQIEAARETQFAGFAKLLMSELLIYFGDFEDMERIIARRAYDLVKHAVALVDPKDLDVLGFDEAVGRIPDMTEWPKEQDSAKYWVDLGGYHGAKNLEVLPKEEE